MSEPVTSRIWRLYRTRNRFRRGSGKLPAYMRSCSNFVERLEPRMVLAAPTLEPIVDQTLLLGAPLHIPLDGFDADLDGLSYSVSSNNPDIVAELRQGNRSMRIHVEYVGDGTPADPSFSGDLVFELFEDLAPRTTAHIIQLIQDGFYNGILFHRVAENGSGQ